MEANNFVWTSSASTVSLGGLGTNSANTVSGTSVSYVFVPVDPQDGDGLAGVREPRCPAPTRGSPGFALRLLEP